MEPLTIKEAVKQTFNNPLIKIPRSTIQTWMQEKIFVPSQRVDYRDPKGCKLDFADLVTLALFRVLTNVGVGYKSLRPPQEGESKRVWFETQHFSRDQLKSFEEAKREHRSIQWFLTGWDFDAHVIVNPDLLWQKHDISFVSPYFLDDRYLTDLRDRDSWYPKMFIKVKPLANLINKLVTGP